MSNLDLTLLTATGFQLFLPLLILSGAAYTGHVSLNESFAWLGTPAAMMIAGRSDCRGNSGLLHSRC